MKSLPPKTKLGRIPRTAIPPEFHDEIARSIQDYCVAIARMKEGDPKTFQVIGSGTLVVRDGRYGVLTAHHCLHAWDPPVKLGDSGDFRIFFISKNGHMPSAMANELSEIPLGPPRKAKYGERGPDLTFIHIPIGPALEALKAYGSFAPLNRNPDAVARRFCVDRAYLANAGYPMGGTTITQGEGGAKANATLVIGAGSLRERDMERGTSWDYINCFFDYQAFSDMRRVWKGMSGGGIWALLLTQKEGRFEIYAYALIGFIFYQTGMRRNRCRLRGPLCSINLSTRLAKAITRLQYARIYILGDVTPSGHYG